MTCEPVDGYAIGSIDSHFYNWEWIDGKLNTDDGQYVVKAIEQKSGDDHYYYCADTSDCAGSADNLVGRSKGKDFNDMYNKTIMQWTNSKSPYVNSFRDTETNDV